MTIVENKLTDYLSINVSETETAWSDTALYNYRDEVRYGHYIYGWAGEDNSNTTENPSFIYDRDKNIYPQWVKLRATNYWAALDDKTSTQTTKTIATSATTDATGYSIGATVITLASAGTGEIIAGDIINFTGDTNDYVIEVGDSDVSDGGTITLASGLIQAIPASATAITVQSKLIIELTNDSYDTITLLNIDATEANIQLIDTSTEAILFDEDYDLSNTVDIIDEKTYWYAPFDFKKNLYEPNLNMLSSTKIKVTLALAGGEPSVGRIVCGQGYFIAGTSFPAKIDQITYSRFETDIFGNTDLQQGESIKYKTYKMYPPLGKLPVLERKRKELTAIPLLFIADESVDSIVENDLTYGYFPTSPFNITNNARFGIDLEIKGLL
jgi:hypothetical protein